ncbi:MAG: MMPL family transporter [Myxococcales bacterium]|nr:MMPL family transporter [Myxococcales bacterium]
MTQPSLPPEAASTESQFFRAWGRFVVRNRWPVLLVNLVITLLLAKAAGSVMTDTSYKAMMIAASEEARIQEKLEDLFGVDAVFMLVIEGDVFSQPYLDKLKRLHTAIEAIDLDLQSAGKRDLRDADGNILVRARDRQDEDEDNPAAAAAGDFAGFGDTEWGDEAGGSIVDEVVSLVNVRDTRASADGLTVRGLLDVWPRNDAELAALRAHALSRKSIVDHVVGPEGRHSVILVRTDFMDSEDAARVDEELRRIAAPFQSEEFVVQFGGVPALTSELNRYLMADVGIVNGIAILLMMILLGVSFRHPAAVLGPIVVVVQAAIWTVGAMAIARVPMTVISTIIPSFLVCVGIGDSVHMLSVFRQCKVEHPGPRQAAVAALAETGRPVLFTTLTTFAGLLSFRFASLDAIRDFGTFAGFGVMIALLQSLVFLPAVLSFCHRGRFGQPVPVDTKPGEATGSSTPARAGTRWNLHGFLLEQCNRFSRPAHGPGGLNYRGRNRVLVGALLFGGLCVLGNSLVVVRHDPLSWMPAESSARKAIDMLDGHVGGTSDISLLIEAPPGKDLRDLDLMRRLAKLEEHILAYPVRIEGAKLVRSSTGLLDVLRESWWALHGQKPEHYRLPDSQRGVVDVVTMFESSGPEDLRRLMTVDATTGLMVVRMLWDETGIYKPLSKHIEAGIREHIGDAAKVYPTGTVYQAIQSDNAVIGDLLSSFGVALLVITGLMMVVLSDLRLALIAMVPNIMPIGAILAIMGFADIGIDMSNLLIASIGISIAVDDTIHFLHHFKSHYSSYGDREQAIDYSFYRAGNAIINTSVILLTGFAVFTIADLSNLRQFGTLISITVALALFVDLVFCPALLRLAFPAHRPVSGTAPLPARASS